MKTVSCRMKESVNVLSLSQNIKGSWEILSEEHVTLFLCLICECACSIQEPATQ